MAEFDNAVLRERLRDLRIEHRDLDAAIGAIEASPYVDQLQVRRLKKRRLHLKDTIRKLESKLIPDLDA
jgi:hypothetical protein